MQLPALFVEPTIT